MPISQSQAMKVLNAQLGKATFATQQVFLGLSSTAPSSVATNITEPIGNGYARVAVLPAVWSPATVVNNVATSTNLTAILFPVPIISWPGTFSHVIFFDAVTGGTVIGWAPLDAPTTIAKDLQLVLPPSSLVVTLA